MTRVAESVKSAIKAYEQTTSLPYDSVPTEVCRARDGTRSIDLTEWSLLVDDVALRCIAAGDRERIDKLAAQSSVDKVRLKNIVLGPSFPVMLRCIFREVATCLPTLYYWTGLLSQHGRRY